MLSRQSKRLVSDFSRKSNGNVLTDPHRLRLRRNGMGRKRDGPLKMRRTFLKHVFTRMSLTRNGDSLVSDMECKQYAAPRTYHTRKHFLAIGLRTIGMTIRLPLHHTSRPSAVNESQTSKKVNQKLHPSFRAARLHESVSDGSRSIGVNRDHGQSFDHWSHKELNSTAPPQSNQQCQYCVANTGGVATPQAGRTLRSLLASRTSTHRTKCKQHTALCTYHTRKHLLVFGLKGLTRVQGHIVAAFCCLSKNSHPRERMSWHTWLDRAPFPLARSTPSLLDPPDRSIPLRSATRTLMFGRFTEQSPLTEEGKEKATSVREGHAAHIWKSRSHNLLAPMDKDNKHAKPTKKTRRNRNKTPKCPPFNFCVSFPVLESAHW